MANQIPNAYLSRTCTQPCEIIRFPSGLTATLNSIGCLHKWVVNFQEKTQQRIVLACIGKPTAPTFAPFKAGALHYWNHISPNDAIDYGDIVGDIHCREMVARAFTKQYGTEFQPSHIVFITGAKSGLICVSKLITKLCPGKKVVLTVPHYPDYIVKPESGGSTEMVLIDVIGKSRLTATAIAEALQQLDPKSVGAFIFNDPNNPMGTVIGEAEWRRIAILLQRYPDALIILDEAYAEIVFDRQHISLITIAPELKHRIILIRSATKGFSASGERIAVIAAWNEEYIQHISCDHNEWLIHAPRSLQYAYAYALEQCTENHVVQLAEFYK